MMEQKKSEADLAYESLSGFAPEKDNGLETPGDEVEHKTLEQGMASPNPSDFQVAMERLLPETGHEHLNLLEVSRVWPDSYNAMQAILVKDLLLKNRKLSLAEAIVTVHTPQSIAIDGEGRMDVLQAMGSAQAAEQKESEKKLGLS